MADSTSNIRQMSVGQTAKEALVNALIDAATPATLFGVDWIASSGLSLAVYGGNVLVGGVITTVANRTLALTASQTNYIEFDPAGTGTTSGLRLNTSGWTAGYIPLWTIVTLTSSINTWTDERYWGAPVLPTLTVNYASDANKTLTQAEARADILLVTGTIGAARNLVLPLTPKIWAIHNGTTGGYSIVAIGATGTGVTITNGSRAIVYSDGTNVQSLSGGVVTGLSENIAFSGDISPTQITGNQNDYNPTGLSTASTLRLTSDASRDITGLQGGADGRILLVHNVGAQNIVLKDESGSSTAAYRFALTGDVTLTPDSVAMLQYDSTSSRWRMVGGSGTGASTIGTHMIPVSAKAMTPRTSNGSSAYTVAAGASGQPDYGYLAFDTASEEYAEFELLMPESWNEGTITFAPVWSHGSTTVNFGVAWSLQGIAISNDDTLAANFGTAQTSVDTGGTTDDLYVGPTSSAITIAGTPAAGDTVFFRVTRVVGDGGDNLGIDARLHGIRIYITTAADTDV
jgi:hypothetical protein